MNFNTSNVMVLRFWQMAFGSTGEYFNTSNVMVLLSNINLDGTAYPNFNTSNVMVLPNVKLRLLLFAH